MKDAGSKSGNDYPETRRAASVPSSPKGDSFDKSIPRPPSYLDREARKIFKHVALQLQTAGILRRVDMHVLAEFAQAVSDVARLTVEIRTEKEIGTGPNKGPVWNQKLGLLKDARSRVLAFGDRLGLSPKMRASLKVPAGERLPDGAGADDEEQRQLDMFMGDQSWRVDPPAPSASSAATGTDGALAQFPAHRGAPTVPPP